MKQNISTVYITRVYLVTRMYLTKYYLCVLKVIMNPSLFHPAGFLGPTHYNLMTVSLKSIMGNRKTLEV